MMKDDVIKEYLMEILKDNRENPPPPRRVKCGDCTEWTKGTLKCKKYPNGIEKDILKEKINCKDFKQK